MTTPRGQVGQEEEDIETLIKCPRCKSRYDVPLLLPCGKTLCSKCVELYSSESRSKEKRLNCPICSGFHRQTQGASFPINTKLKELVEKESERFYRGKPYTDLEQTLGQLNESIADLNQKHERKFICLKDHCETLRHEVRLAAERKLAELKQDAEKLLKVIDSLEALDYVLLKKDKHELTKEYQQLKTTVEKFCADWQSRLSKPLLREHEAIEAKKVALKLNTLIAQQAQSLNKHLITKTDVTLIYKETNLKNNREENMLGKFEPKNPMLAAASNFPELKFTTLDCLTPLHSGSDLCCFDDDNTLLTYKQSSLNVEFKFYDKFGHSFSKSLPFENYPQLRNLLVYKNNIFYSTTGQGTFDLHVYFRNMESQSLLDYNEMFDTFDVHKHFVYYLCRINREICIYRLIDNRKLKRFDFLLRDRFTPVDRMFVRNSNFYLVQLPNTLSVLSWYGNLMRTVETINFKSSGTYFISEKFVYLVDLNARTVERFDLIDFKSVMKGSINFNGAAEINLRWCVNRLTDKLIFYNNDSRDPKIFYEK